MYMCAWVHECVYVCIQGDGPASDNNTLMKIKKNLLCPRTTPTAAMPQPLSQRDTEREKRGEKQTERRR